MVALHPCPGCKRHVRDDASSCPFCDAPLALREALQTEQRAPKRLGRAARMAFGAAIATSMTVAAACSGGPGPTPSSDGGSEDEDAKNEDGKVIVNVDSSTQDVAPPPDDAIAMPYGAPPADGLRRVV